MRDVEKLAKMIEREIKKEKERKEKKKEGQKGKEDASGSVGDITVQEKEALTGRFKIDIKNMPYEYIEIYNIIKMIYQYDRAVMMQLIKTYVKYEWESLIGVLDEAKEKIKKIKDILSGK
jgi:hypothetical protein